jgi:hypothetical protein
MSRLEDFGARHAIEIKDLYERAGAAHWKIPEEQWIGAIYRAAILSQSPESRLAESRTRESLCKWLHADDFAFALAFRLGCHEAMNNFMVKYKTLLHNLALDVSHDEGRAKSLAEVVFRELYGEVEEDGRRRSLFQDFDGRVSLVSWLRAIVTQRHTSGLAAQPRSHTPCPAPTALAAYGSLVRVSDFPYRGLPLRPARRDEIRHHLRVCSRCQARLVASQQKDGDSGGLQSVAGKGTTRSAVWSSRVMRIAGVVAILAGALSLVGEPQQFVSGFAAILHGHTVGRHPRALETREETTTEAIPSGVESASRRSEPLEQPLIAGFSRAESTSDAAIFAMLPSRAPGPDQLSSPVSEDKSAADTSTVSRVASTKGRNSRGLRRHRRHRSRRHRIA